MTGAVDQYGRAVISVQLAAEQLADPVLIDVRIDTGFTGELLLPQRVIDEMSLEHGVSEHMILADGSRQLMPMHSCWVDWFGRRRMAEAIARSSDIPLLGVGC
jgi:clan AA aspartic protease